MTENGWVYQARFHKGVLLLVILGMLFAGSFNKRLPVVQAENTEQTRNRKVYLPNIASGAVRPASTSDLTIQRVEVTQAVQDSQNSVPLVAGRATMLRIYAVNSGDSKSIPNVNIAIVGAQGGAMVEGVQQEMTATVNSTASPALYSSTINFPLPTSWASGTYDLVVALDGNNAIPESNEGNNTKVIRLTFNAVPPLRIMIVPISYTSSETGVSYPAPTTETISDYIRRMYPVGQVEVTRHAPYAFTGNMKELGGFSSLLSQISALKTSENAPASQVYYALVPTRVAASSWFQGGLVGLGYIGSRVAVGLDYSNAGSTAAHEIGHNLGRYHAPCGNPSSPDASYPYPSAAIGHYGLDVVSGVLFGPNDSKDIMSYCSPKWISDYTYKALYAAQRLSSPDIAPELAAQSAGEPASEAVLSVRAQFGSAGASFFPVYPVYGVPTALSEGSPYRLQLVGQDGALLSDTPYQALEIATETDAELFEIQAQLPVPVKPASAVRLVRDGVILAEQSLVSEPAVQAAFEGANVPVVSEEETAGGLRLRWDVPGTVLVRYSEDGGASWKMLAADVTGGELVVDASLRGRLFQVVPASSAQ